MSALFGNAEVVAREIGGHFRPGRDKIVRPRKCGIITRALWPEKTAAIIAEIARCEERQAKRYISGEYEAPYLLVRRVIDEMLGIGD